MEARTRSGSSQLEVWSFKGSNGGWQNDESTMKEKMVLRRLLCTAYGKRNDASNENDTKKQKNVVGAPWKHTLEKDNDV